MHCHGERLSITSGMEWPQMKGERLLAAPNNKNAATASASATAANSSGACTDTHGKVNMIHANSTAAAAAASNVGARAMDKSPVKDHHHHQAALRCPRCDSSNTKFCYYNNYSLSQPRHFCKACKRYWTRGGTLRNVPVGGGCRKNKRTKKPASAAAAHHLIQPSNLPQPRPARSLLPTDPIPPHGSGNPSQVNAASLYALQMAASSSSSSPSSDMSLTLPMILSSLGNPSCAAASDLLPHLGALGLGLSSNPQCHSAEYLLGSLQPLPPVGSTATSTFLSDYPLSGSSLLPSASLLASGIKHLKQVENYDHVLLPFDEMQACGMMKEVNLEGQNDDTIDYSNLSSSIDCQFPPDHPLDNFGPAAAAMYWNAATGAWLENGTNCGSSIAPLI